MSFKFQVCEKEPETTNQICPVWLEQRNDNEFRVCIRNSAGAPQTIIIVEADSPTRLPGFTAGNFPIMQDAYGRLAISDGRDH